MLYFSLFLNFSFLVQFKIGLCQLSVSGDKERNIAHARTAIEEAASKGAKLVLLPVSFPYSFRNRVLCQKFWRGYVKKGT